MKPKFEILFMKEAEEFLEEMNEKARTKLLYNLKKAQLLNDSSLFKKLSEYIWEFRSQTQGNQYRLFAFWDKEGETLVICTHGILKKSQKTPKKEIEKAEKLRSNYFKNK
ncbi:MAG: type II toxin-antitoxin system RelE/ParE family toxin [Bacteroidota bacterium]